MSLLDVLRKNIIYLAYCKAKGHPDPNKMLERDSKIYVGSSTTGFILWNAHHVHEYIGIKYPELNASDRATFSRILNMTEYQEWIVNKYPLTEEN